MNNFFCFIPLSFGAMLEFEYIENGLFILFYVLFQLQFHSLDKVWHPHR